MQKLTVGLDLGGTKAQVVLCDAKGKILFQKKKILKLVESHLSPAQSQKWVVEELGLLVAEAQAKVNTKKQQVVGVGLASAGPLNVERGTLIHPSNMPGWKIVPIVSLLKKELQKRKLNSQLYFQNDAMAAALGEGWIGRAKGLSNYAVITVGTGVGSGIIFRGQPLQFNGLGSEAGHMIVQFKNRAPEARSVEEWSCGPSLLARAKSMGFQGEKPEDLVKAILHEGRDEYRALFNSLAESLAALAFNLSITLNLEKIIFSGGLMDSKDLFWTEVKGYYNQWIEAFNSEFKAKLELAALKNQAGAVGAAYLPLID